MKLGLSLFATLGLLIGFLWLAGGGQGSTAPLGARHVTPNASQSLTTPDQSANKTEPAIQFAPDFNLKNLDGRNVTLAQYRDQKPVILDFWASWCPNCRRDMPKLNAWYQKYQGQVEVIGVNLQESESTVRDFISRQGINFPIVLDPTGQASQSYGVRYTNYHILIDKSGQLVKTVPGDLSEGDITSLLNA